MFKNLTIFRLTTPFTHSLAAFEEALQAMRFVKCGPTQDKSVGWTAPRGIENGPLVESIGGQLILKLAVETKVVPSRSVADKAEEQAKKVFEDTGRKLGKKQMRDLKDEVRLSLLPLAFTKSSSVTLWIDPKAQLLVVDSASQSHIDDVTTYFLQSFDGLFLQLPQTTSSPGSAMSTWLANKEAPEGFSVDRECELRANDESKSVIRYTRHSLDNDEVAQHIAAGKLVTKLAMSWGDRLSFLLTDTLKVKRLAFLDGVFKDQSASGDNKDDQFDADVALATGELARMLPELFAALGGLASDAAASKIAAGVTGSPVADEEDLYKQAVEVVRQAAKASISLVQRHLRIGYNAAARLLETMETRGVVSRPGPDGMRSVLA